MEKDVENYINVINYLKINRYGNYPPTQTTKDMYRYFKEIKLNFTLTRLNSGFYRFELHNKGESK